MENILDNEFLSLFIPETTNLPKEEYIEELKIYIFKIMGLTLSDLVQENINLSDANVELHHKLKFYLEEKIDSILDVNNTFLNCLGNLEMIIYHIDSVKNNINSVLKNSSTKSKLEKIKQIQEEIALNKEVLESPILQLLEVPAAMFRCIQNDNLELFIEFDKFMKNYFSDISKEIDRFKSSTNLTNSLNNVDSNDLKIISEKSFLSDSETANLFISKIKSYYDKVREYCISFLKNNLKLNQNSKIINEFLYEIIFPIKEFDENIIKCQFIRSVNLITNIKNEINYFEEDSDISRIYKILVLIIYQIELQMNSLIVNYSEKLVQEDEKESFIKSSITADNQIIFLKYIFKQLKYLTDSIFKNSNHKINDSLNSDSKESLKISDENKRDIVDACINELIIDFYLIPTIEAYLQLDNTSFSGENCMILNFKNKLNTINELINKNVVTYKLNSDKIEEKVPLPEYVYAIGKINIVIQNYCSRLLQAVVEVNNKLIKKFLLFNRGDINKLVKIDNNKKTNYEKNEFINLLFINLSFFLEITKDFKFNSIIFKSNTVELFENHLFELNTLLNEYFMNNSVLLRISVETIDLIKELISFKDLYLLVLNEILNVFFCNLDLEVSGKEKSEKIINNINSKFIYNFN
jgi:hypothetical protein